MRKTGTLKRLALCSILSALYLVLCLLDINLGGVKITLAAFVIYFVSFALDAKDCFFVVLLGTFLNQLVYGFTPTTVLWMLPPFLRPLVISPIRAKAERNGSLLEEKRVFSVFLVLFTSLLTTLANTGVLYLDSLIIGYSYQAVLYKVVIQSVATMGAGLIEIFLLFPLLKALRKVGFLEDKSQIQKRMLCSLLQKKRK